jgi:hypothetical protein
MEEPVMLLNPHKMSCEAIALLTNRNNLNVKRIAGTLTDLEMIGIVSFHGKQIPFGGDYQFNSYLNKN